MQPILARNHKSPRSLVRASLLAALCALPASQVHTQSTVRVVDVDSIPIPFALVSLGSSAPRATDAAGVVRFSAPLGDVAALSVQRIGYRPFKAGVQRSGDAMYVVVLQPIPRGLDTVRTVAERETPLSRTGFYDRMERVHKGAISGEFITPEELERRNANKISDMLRGRRSVQVGSVSTDGRPRTVLNGRGGACAMIVLLDGVRINSMLEDTNRGGARTSLKGGHSSGRGIDPRIATSVDELVVPREVMAIEIYGSTANAPAELIPLTGGGSCGLVALWTGPRR